MKNVVIGLGQKVPEIVQGQWQRNDSNHVTLVICDCGRPIFYEGAIHSRIVIPGEGVALCKGCKRLVRVPVQLAALESAQNDAKQLS